MNVHYGDPALWKSKAEDRGDSGGDGALNTSQPPLADGVLKFRGGGLPSGGMCVCFSVPGLWKCFVFRQFCDFREIWGARVSRVSFQHTVWGQFVKKVYMKVRQAFRNAEKICFSPPELITSRSWEPWKRTLSKCLLQWLLHHPRKLIWVSTLSN